MGQKGMRIEGWEQQLHAYLEAARQTSFQWGVNDCCLWVSRWVDSITGTNHAVEWARLYFSESGATDLMHQRGFASPAAIADAALPKIPVKTAGRGDIVMHPTGALGICDGRLSYFLLPRKGVTALPTLNCRKAWSV